MEGWDGGLRGPRGAVAGWCEGPQRAASSEAGFGGLVSSQQMPKIHLSSRPVEVQRAFAEPWVQGIKG